MVPVSVWRDALKTVPDLLVAQFAASIATGSILLNDFIIPVGDFDPDCDRRESKKIRFFMIGNTISNSSAFANNAGPEGRNSWPSKPGGDPAISLGKDSGVDARLRKGPMLSNEGDRLTRVPVCTP